MRALTFIILAGFLAAAGCGGATQDRLRGKEDIPVTRPDPLPEPPPATTLPADPDIKDRPDIPAQPPRTPATRATGPGDSEPVELTDPYREPAATMPAARVPLGKSVVASSVIQVNDQFITTEEVVHGASRKIAEIPRNFTDEQWAAQAGKILTEEIFRHVTEVLVMGEAKLRITEETQKRIDAEVEQTLGELVAEIGQGSRKRLEQTLVAEGTTLQAVLDAHRRRVTVQGYVHEKFAAAIRINRTTMLDYYTRNRQQFTRAAQVQMQTISAPFKSFLPPATAAPTADELADAKAKAKAHIDAAAVQLKAGKDFGDVAVAYSKDIKAADKGLWSMMPSGSFKEQPVEEAAFKLAEGKVSELIETPAGFYIVRAAKVQPGVEISFEDAQPTIEDKLRQQQERALSDEYFLKLRQDARVIEHEKFLQLALELAKQKHGRMK